LNKRRKFFIFKREGIGIMVAVEVHAAPEPYVSNLVRLFLRRSKPLCIKKLEKAFALLFNRAIREAALFLDFFAFDFGRVSFLISTFLVMSSLSLTSSLV
jgi:hypothetical protein